MRKTGLLIATIVVAGTLGLAPVHAKEDRPATIKRLQAEAKKAELNAQAAAQSAAAYEEAWKKTQAATKDAVCAAGRLYGGPIGALPCLGTSALNKR